MQASERPGGKRTSLRLFLAPILNNIEAGTLDSAVGNRAKKQWTILMKRKSDFPSEGRVGRVKYLTEVHFP